MNIIALSGGGAASCTVLALVERRDRALRCLANLSGHASADRLGYQAVLLEAEIAATPAASAAGRRAQVELARRLADQQEEAGDGDERVIGLLRTLASYAAEGLAGGPAQRG